MTRYTWTHHLPPAKGVLIVDDDDGGGNNIDSLFKYEAFIRVAPRI